MKITIWLDKKELEELDFLVSWFMERGLKLTREQTAEHFCCLSLGEWSMKYGYSREALGA